MIKVIALVESPLQFLNAQEYLMSLDEKFEVRFFIFMDKGRKGSNEFQLRKMLELYNEENYRFYGINSKTSRINKLFKTLAQSISLIRYRDSSILIIGDIRSSFFQFFALILKCKKHISVDDGNATLHAFQVKNRINMLFKSNILDTSSFSFFTIYSSFLKGKNTIANSYEYTRKRFQTSLINTNKYIVGTTLVEVDIINEENYFELLKRIAADSSESMVYLRHRYEDHEKLDRISKMFGFEIHQCELPLEVETLLGRIQPHTFYGTISSFFDNIGYINESIKVVIAKIESSDILDDRSAKRLSKSYDAYEKSNFKII